MALSKRYPTEKFLPLASSLLLASLASIVLYIGGVIRDPYYGYGYMVWNLFLAWVPLLLIVWLRQILKRKRWSSWQGITLSVLWLGFLPNSFYMISDYIHLEDQPSIDVLYDAVMLTSFVLTGLFLGYLSLYLFHNELSKRLPARSARRIISIIIFMCSIAIYLGRDLRWNTWDLFVNPAGILFDVSDRLITSQSNSQMFITIFSFYLLLGTIYIIIRNIAHQSPSAK